MKIATMLLNYRKKNGLSQTELAMQVGLNQSTISRLEKGGNVRVSNRNRILSFIGPIEKSYENDIEVILERIKNSVELRALVKLAIQ